MSNETIEHAIAESSHRDITVTLSPDSPAEFNALEEVLLVECDEHDCEGLFWGAGWQIHLKRTPNAV